MPLPVLRTAAGLTPAERPDILVALLRAPDEGAALTLPRSLRGLLSDLGGPDAAAVLAHLARSSNPARAGALTDLPLGDSPLGGLLLVGAGDSGVGALRRAGACVGRALRDRRAVNGDRVSVAVAGLRGASAQGVRAFGEGLALAAYAFGRAAADLPGMDVTLLVDDRRADAVRRAQITAQAVHRARDLTNTPSSTKSPAWLADQAVATAPEGVSVRVLDEVQLAAQGFGGILAVGMGSVRPPRLVELTYSPRAARGERLPHIVLVGKGVTFDTGGISLKPSESMVAMKTDMAGAAAVLSVINALPELGARVRVTGLLCCAENMPSGSAMRPSDVIRHYGGRTVEVLNTDAEGRLVLADGLAYADARLAPDVVVDIATLTGAVGIALGRRDAALFANDEPLAAGLQRAAADSGERVWRLPLVEDYRPALESLVADLANISMQPTKYSGGTITAALFLAEFAGSRAWAHLDIAATGRSDGDSEELTKGATGYGVRLLLRWLESFA